MNPNQQESVPQQDNIEVPPNYEPQIDIENKNKARSPASPEKKPSTPPPQTVVAQDDSTDDSTDDTNSTTSATKPSDKPTKSEPTKVVSGMIADNGDLIEKEWVDRAKSVVDSNKNDPHAQNKGMNIVKADYLKKRYNKDLVVEDD